MFKMTPRTRKPAQGRLQAAQSFQAPLPTTDTSKASPARSTAVTEAFGPCGGCIHYAGTRYGHGYCVRWRSEALAKEAVQNGCLLLETA